VSRLHRDAFAELASRFDDDKVVEIVRKTLKKMSDAGKAAALAITLDPADRALIERAVAAAESVQQPNEGETS